MVEAGARSFVNPDHLRQSGLYDGALRICTEGTTYVIEKDNTLANAFYLRGKAYQGLSDL